MKIKDIKAVQDLAYCVGQWGCYLICLCIVAEEITGKEIDILKTAKYLIDNKIVDYDYQRPKAFKNSMYVFDANKVLAYLGCSGYYIDKVPRLPEGFDGKYIVRHTLEGATHFTVPDYDPMTYNKVAAEGRVTAYYLVRKDASKANA